MRLFSLAVLSLATIGCGGPWTIVKQTNPTPFNATTTFSVQPATWDPNLKVGKKTEADFLASKDANGKASHESDKQAFGAELSATVMTQSKGLQMAPQGGQFTIKPTVYWMEPGYYIGISAGDAEVKVRVDVLDASGQPVDTIEVHGRGAATEPFNPVPRATVGERLKIAADEVGQAIGRYLRERAGVK
jgi:hypothetical protein